jgi:hypothetical protein
MLFVGTLQNNFEEFEGSRINIGAIKFHKKEELIPPANAHSSECIVLTIPVKQFLNLFRLFSKMLTARGKLELEACQGCDVMWIEILWVSDFKY